VLPGVREVFTPRTLARAAKGDLEAGRWRRQMGPDVGWLVAVALHPDWTWTTGKSSTGHGSTNLDDVRVPLLFRVPGVPAAVVDRRVRTIDLAPTLARVLGIRPTEPVEGVALSEVLRGRLPR
jgi:arylsulfatase A-like enzyme